MHDGHSFSLHDFDLMPLSLFLAHTHTHTHTHTRTHAHTHHCLLFSQTHCSLSHKHCSLFLSLSLSFSRSLMPLGESDDLGSQWRHADWLSVWPGVRGGAGPQSKVLVMS